MEDRPIECSSCKHKPHIVFKEIVDGKIVTTSMCSNCPIFQKKLGKQVDLDNDNSDSSLMNLSCTNCQTTFQKILMGEPMGCPKCYTFFEDLLIKELKSMDCVPSDPKSSSSKEKQTSFHLGKMPENLDKNNISTQLETLNTALGEALALENYEMAANIRDQINTLLENPNGK